MIQLFLLPYLFKIGTEMGNSKSNSLSDENMKKAERDLLSYTGLPADAIQVK